MKLFQDLENFTDDDLDAAIRRDDPQELQLVPITVAVICPDCSAAQAVCIRLCSHAHNRVRAHSLISLAFLARRFRNLDEKTVKPIIEHALADADDYVRFQARSAADEIHQFLHWNMAGHAYGSGTEAV